MNARIRPMMLIALLSTATAVRAGEIILYEDVDFHGNSMRVNSEVSSLDGTGMNDRVQSAIVREGVWEVCRDANFGGGCIQMPPGRYPRMDGNFVRNISSLREVGDARYAGGVPPPYPQQGTVAPAYRPQAYAVPPPQGGRYAQAVLYEGHDFQGRAFPIGGDVVRNLDRNGFNDRAGSLRVESGYWVFCSDANFEGECRTFGPGEYPNLPRELDHRISSGRQISSAYPYSGPPQWDRH